MTPKYDSATKVACVGDLQLPYTDYRAVQLWFDIMKWWKPSHIVFTGDVDDQLEYSSFSDGTTDEFFNQIRKSETDSPLPFVKENAEAARKFYNDVRAQHKRSELFSCLGNHDIRVYKYMDRKAPEYKDQVTPDFLYNFNKLGIDFSYYEDKPTMLLPDTYFHHGATTSSSGSAVAKDIDSYGVSLVRGHDHRGALVHKTFPLSNKTLFGLDCGHMCDTDSYGIKYTINPSWEMGFGIIHVHGSEVFPQFIRIHSDYTCVIDGKFFQG